MITGHNFILRVMNELEIVIGTGCKTFCDREQEARIDRQERRSRSRGRPSTSEPEKGLRGPYQDEEELFYGPGIAD